MAISTRTDSQPASDRHERGLVAFAAMVNYWVGRSSLSQAHMERIADWGMGEEGFIDKTNVSRLQNRQLVKGPSWRHVDALAAANEAIWLWQTQGQQAAQAKLGPPSSYGIKAEWLDNAIWLPSPDDAEQPLQMGQMAELAIGRLELPYLATAALSPMDAKRASDLLAEILNQAIVEIGLGAKDGIERLMDAYPPTDAARRRRLKRLILGEARLTREQLETELDAMAVMLQTVRGLKAESYGPAELRAELVPALPPAS